MHTHTHTHKHTQANLYGHIPVRARAELTVHTTAHKKTAVEVKAGQSAYSHIPVRARAELTDCVHTTASTSSTACAGKEATHTCACDEQCDP